VRRGGLLGVAIPLGMWCPVEDTDLPFRMVCFRIITLFQEAGCCIFAELLSDK